MFLLTGVGGKEAFAQTSPNGIPTDTTKTIRDTLAIEEVEINTGYQRIPRERATGSFVFLDSALIGRRVSTTITDRLEGITSGLVFNSNIQAGENESPFSVRGRSTLFANTKPLIIIDNFPYEGDIDNINPNDVASITVLKDAAAASIWGARSGNGVIVITTKSGKLDQPTEIGLTSNVTVGNRPDLYYHPQLTNVEYIALERDLFGRGFYNGQLNARPRGILSPAVELLAAHRDDGLPEAELDRQLAELARYDIRDDLSRYFYRPSVAQQYQLHASGGSAVNSFYLSAGYDRNTLPQVGNDYGRVSFQGRNRLLLLKDRLDLTTTFNYTGNSTQTNAVSPGVSYPYARLVDDDGQALPLYNKAGRSRSYVDTAGRGLLLDWAYRPYDDLSARDNQSRLHDLRLNQTITARLLDGLQASAQYQYNRGTRTGEDLQTVDYYNTRDLINQYLQLDYAGNRITQAPYPVGDILYLRNDAYRAHNLRLQLAYERDWAEHAVSALGGYEVQDYRSTDNSHTLYGYDARNATSQPLIHGAFVTRPYGNSFTINTPMPSRTFLTDRFISYFANGSYTYRNRYVLSASARKDESNLFGVDANQRGVPLWSVGGSWELSREPFYRMAKLPYLRLRATYGFNGNIDKTVSAYTTASPSLPAVNRYGALQYSIINPPNPDLRWEKIAMVNAGVDFRAWDGRLSGSVEYFRKDATDLIGFSPASATTGITQFKGNHANLVTSGMDMQLDARLLTGKVVWSVTALWSHVLDEVTRYLLQPPSLTAMVNHDFSYPVEGRPYHAIHAYRWAGLDPATGDPMGYFNGRPSSDYSAIVGTSEINDIAYLGPGRPTHFGSVRNTLAYAGVSLSVNVTFKAGHVFRDNSVDYGTLVATFGGAALQPHYARRWQQPGDERTTHVPSLGYPVNYNREGVYRLSEVLVDRGDHIRLQDMRLEYDLARMTNGNRLKRAAVYLYANNLGVLWKATGSYVDPDYVSSTSAMNHPQPATYALGFTATF